MAKSNDSAPDLIKREKRCTKCRVVKPLTEFWRRNDRAPHSVKPRCKMCANDPVYNAEYRRKNPRKRQDEKLRYYFGITVEQYDAMLEEQGHVCAICKQPERSKRYVRLCVDHCHATGGNRGLLCNRCNRGVGLFGDSPENLRSAARYLERGTAG